MTPQEQQMLQDLTSRVNQTPLTDKDPEAEQYLASTLGRNPDALYLLAQTVLVQQYALDQAKKQIDALQSQTQQLSPPPPQKHTSFLGNLLGMNDDHPQQQSGYTTVPNTPPPPAQYGNQYGQPGYPPQPGYAQQGYVQQPPQGGGFLRNAMQTAAGVAAGAFAFQGIENLMGGFEHHAGYGGGQGFGDVGGQREEVVNNYYGASGDQHGAESRDIEDRRDDSFGSRLENADSGDRDDSGNDDSGNDNSGNDNTDSSDNYDPGGTDDSF